jgi:hypothetical protein
MGSGPEGVIKPWVGVQMSFCDEKAEEAINGCELLPDSA